MKLCIISGSTRNDSNSKKLAKFAQEYALSKSMESSIIDLQESPIPMFDDSFFAKDSALNKCWKPFSKTLTEATAFIVISPEWHGMVPSALKNFLLCCSQSEVGHKPGLIMGVSSGIGGSYPISELRQSGYKNNRICWIPEHIILRNAADILAQEQPQNETQVHTKERIQDCIQMLKVYSDNFENIRKNLTWDFTKYPNGL